MNKQRVKSIGILAAVLLAGILIGALVPAAFHHSRGRQYSKTEQHGEGGDRSRDVRRSDWFVYKIKQVVKADSSQVKAIDSVATWANERMNSIESDAHQQSIHVLDSAVVRLTPMLREDQQKSLTEFREQIATKAKDRRRYH